MSGTWLVIPSCRMDSLRQFFDAWKGRGGWDQVVIVEDAPEKSHQPWIRDTWLHYSHAEIKEVLEEDSWIISRKDSACRCFGFLLAWWGGAERVITLDDDVRPIDVTTNLVANHIAAAVHSKWLSSVYGLRVRGLPYGNTGRLSDVVANIGLWTNHMDFDAISQLSVIGNDSNPSYHLPTDNWIIPHGQFAPVCGMNLMLERRALPLAYFPLMGEGQPFARFDDIFAGIILKHCCDALSWHVSVGKPFVRHDKASDPFVNLRKEAPGIGANETFWERIADIKLGRERDATGCMIRVGEEMTNWDGEYWNRLGLAMIKWSRTFLNKPAGLKL